MDRAVPALLVGLCLVISLLALPDASFARTVNMSVDPSGNPVSGESSVPFVSSNARYVAFDSHATNLVANDTNGRKDIFVYNCLNGQVTRVSVDSSGIEANNDSSDPSLSADGRYVAFESRASNLVPGDTNTYWDIFVHDRQAGATSRVSVSSSGAEANHECENPSISGDGRYVAFFSYANTLVPNDFNSARDIFVHDRDTGSTTRVSVSSSAEEGNGASEYGRISEDGRYVVFESDASNLVFGDTNGRRDIFVHELQTGITTRVSVDSTGSQATGGDSEDPSISGDGRYVAFTSDASNLVAGDTNGWEDIFVHDRQTGETTRVSVDSSGTQGNSSSRNAYISTDGLHVAFDSFSTNLIASDANGPYDDIFVHHRETGVTECVSVASDGTQGESFSYEPTISGRGTHTAFVSNANNLVDNDTNSIGDVFLNGPRLGAQTHLPILLFE